MTNLIKENKFEDLKEILKNSTEFQIHTYLLDILNYKTVKIDAESFSAKRYQEEFLEGLTIFEALKESDIDKIQLTNFLNILIELGFKMGGFIQLMAQTAMNKGVYLSDIEDLYKVNPIIRQKLQEFIEHLKNFENQDKSIANLSATKAQISNSIGNLLQKHEIGEDMLQFAQSYEKVEQTEMAARIYQGIMNDFESESVKSSSGLFPEISYVDDRPEDEINIFETAKTNFERLTGQIVQEPKRVHINESKKAKEIVAEMEKSVKQTENENESGFLNKLKRLFKKN
ncbi:hypothetical protein BXU11_16195 [Flavobacterium sp. LM5]|jgi:hypothetical protein|uniref:hypothetical protein n=1 Tax=Flavobacterium sp. LM5 TaxID=1938610 RepID=UPI000991D848|nr:hypothetical protein [Flavobacterium sp. LM5]OOV25086.1 hypothetical protein BXU11_16195 [Flavobacterium sp. LM5]